MRINLRSVEPHVAQHRLDVANVGAPFEHQCRHGMAEDVTRSTLADSRRFHVLAREPTQVVRREWDTVRSEEYDPVVWFPHDFGSQTVQIQVEPGQSPFTDRHHAVPLAFSLSNSYETVFLVHVVQFQV